MISRYHLINLTRTIKVCNDKNVVMEATRKEDMKKFEVGVYRTSFNSVVVEAGSEQEAKDIALIMEGIGELELFADKRAEAMIEEVV